MNNIVIKGGIGNQMFQYTFYLFLRKKYKRQRFTFDLSSFEFENSATYTKRNFNLHEAFKINLKNYRSSFELRIKKFLNLKSICDFKLIDDSTFYENKKYHDVIFDGYWQNSLYIDNQINEISKVFSFRQTPTIKEGTSRIKYHENSVGIHVRRGDYVTNSVIASIHEICSKQYYIRAVNHLKNKINSNITIFVFTDDLTWCKENLFFTDKTYYLGDEIVLKDWEELALLSKCSHQIISNSTFSWWAAKLNQNKNSFKIAPSNWFVEEEKNNEYSSKMLTGFEIL